MCRELERDTGRGRGHVRLPCAVVGGAVVHYSRLWVPLIDEAKAEDRMIGLGGARACVSREIGD